jgi:hypothetical protein
MIDASTHTRKIWRSHFDGADSTLISLWKKQSKLQKMRLFVQNIFGILIRMNVKNQAKF